MLKSLSLRFISVSLAFPSGLPSSALRAAQLAAKHPVDNSGVYHDHHRRELAYFRHGASAASRLAQIGPTPTYAQFDQTLRYSSSGRGTSQDMDIRAPYFGR